VFWWTDNGDKWSQNKWRSECIVTSSMHNGNNTIYLDHNPCAIFKNRQLLKCQPLFTSFFLLVDNEAITCRWVFIIYGVKMSVYEVKMSEEARVVLSVCWMVTHIYIDHNPCALFKNSSCCNANHCSPPAFFYIVDIEVIICHCWWEMESKKSEEAHVWMDTSSISNGKICLYSSYTICSIHKKTVATVPTTVILLLACSWLWCHHLSLVIYGVKVSEEAHLWLPSECNMLKQVYIHHTPCPKFTKRQNE
jgi:hypothetical protein